MTEPVPYSDPDRPTDDWATIAYRKRVTKTRGVAEVKRQMRKLGYNILNQIQRIDMWPCGFRNFLIRRMGHNLSCNTNIAEGLTITGVGLITCGDVSINARCHIEAAAEVYIGEGVRIACEVLICTSTHDFGPSGLRAADIKRLPVRIGAGCWIGARAVILPGIEIAPGCIIAAGAVVVNNTMPDGIYGGVPARRIRDII